MVCWRQNSEWGGKVLQVGNGEEGKEWGSIESGPIEYLIMWFWGLRIRFWYIWVFYGFCRGAQNGTMSVSLDLRFGLRAGLLRTLYPCVLNTRAVA